MHRGVVYRLRRRGEFEEEILLQYWKFKAAERNFLRIITESLNNFGVLGNPGWLEEVVHKANLKNYLLAQGAFEETLKEYVNTLEEIMKERL